VSYAPERARDASSPATRSNTTTGIVRLVRNDLYAPLTSEDTILQAGPLGFDASTWELWGSLLNGGRLAVLPPGRDAKVRGLQVHGRPQRSAEAGQRVAVNLGGVEVSDVVRGHTLADRGAFEPTRRLDVRLALLSDARPLRQGARVRFHCGTAEILGRVALSRETQPGDARDRTGPGEPAAYARIRLESPAVVTRGDRFILRAYSPLATIGGGVVLDPRPPRVSIRSAAGTERSLFDAGTDIAFVFTADLGEELIQVMDDANLFSHITVSPRNRSRDRSKKIYPAKAQSSPRLIGRFKRRG